MGVEPFLHACRRLTSTLTLTLVPALILSPALTLVPALILSPGLTLVPALTLNLLHTHFLHPSRRWAEMARGGNPGRTEAGLPVGEKATPSPSNPNPNLDSQPLTLTR